MALGWLLFLQEQTKDIIIRVGGSQLVTTRCPTKAQISWQPPLGCAQGWGAQLLNDPRKQRMGIWHGGGCPRVPPALLRVRDRFW
jgi:hypothetical protein